jgi:WD40 repeat protein
MEGVPANPFKGLRPYSQEDRDKLYGRDRDLILMKDRVFSARTTLLFAGSGVGKTSFLNAKIIPELKKQYAVVWHNHWTGADEHDDDREISEEPVRFWRPRAILRELVRKFRAFHDREATTLPVKREQLERIEDPLEIEVRKTISLNLRRSPSGAKQRLSQVLSGFRKSAKDENVAAKDAPNRCILILDQFEEVFQYHAYEDYFTSFIKDLCEIINNDDYQVRVVFSMREEFLGELSVFDNRIPDLFNNYYRLRSPDKDEAEDIIRRTCRLSGVDPDEKNLPRLVEDLSKIAKGSGSFAERATGPGQTTIHVIKRNFVQLPYLQIACERLWSQQYQADESKRGSRSADSNQTLKDVPSFSPFLIDYKSGNGDGSNREPGGDAQRALTAFCEEKLSPPFLSRNEQDIVARAFSFLVTKQGAKMAYELRSLADHMEERTLPLKTALEKLSQDEAKLLRESRGPDRSYWFELYHDMYATIVDDWKVRYLKRRRRRNLRRAAIGSMIVPGLILLIIVLFHWIVYPFRYENQLIDFQNQIGDANLEQRLAYKDAVSAFTNLEKTPGYSRIANSLWAHILERRAQWYEATNDPARALMSLLKAASMESNAAERTRLLKATEVMLGSANGSLLATYCDDCVSASLSPDGKTVLTMNLDGQVRLWKANPIEPLGPPFCAYCTQSRPAARKAMFSADGKQVLTVSGVASCDDSDTRSDDPTRTETGLRVQLWDTATQAPLPKPFCLEEVNTTEEGNTAEVSRETGPTLGRDSAARFQDVPPTIDIRAFAKVGDKFWIGGIRGKEIHVWDNEGSERTIGSGRNPSSIGIAFTPDGLYLFGIFSGESIKLWRLTESQITPYPFKNVLALALGSPHQVLTAEAGNVVRIVDPESGRVLVSVNPTVYAPTDARIQTIGFNSTGEQFVTRSRDDDGDIVQAWRTSTGEPLFNRLRLSGEATRTGLSPEGKTLVAVEDADLPVIEKWDLPSGRLIGAFKRQFGTLNFSPDRDSMLVLFDKTARLFGLDANLAGSRLLQGRKIEPQEITPDGKVLLAVNDSAQLRFWDVETGKQFTEPIDSDAAIQMARISDDGKYAATASTDMSIQVWQAGKPLPLATFSDGGNPEALAFSRDAKLLASAVAKNVRIWNIATRSQLTLNGHTATVNDVTMTNRQALTGSDDMTARIWDLSNGQPVQKLVNRDQVKAVAFSADGRLALTGCNDGTLQLWETQSGKRIGGELKVKGPINKITFSSDGSMCAALTPSWIYLARVDEHGVTFAGGALIADPWEPIFAFLPDGSKIRFAYQFGANVIQAQDLDLHSDLKEFKGDPQELLELWGKKLGMRAGELGRIEERWADETLQDESEQSRQSRKSARY